MRYWATNAVSVNVFVIIFFLLSVFQSENLKISGDDRAQIMTDTVSQLRKRGLSLTDLCKKLEELKKICDEGMLFRRQHIRCKIT